MPPEPIDTPEWVRDAVFYQIFPDRFARSERLGKTPERSARLPSEGAAVALRTDPATFEPWELPPTQHGFKGGDLFGVAERLPELVELGVTALYLSPIFASASNHRYHTYDYLAVDPLLGGDAALRELLDRAHGFGMRVILDGVFNHSGRGFWPFHHVVENGPQSPYRDWFHLDPEVLAGERALNPYPDRGGPALHRGPLGYRAWWGLSALPKLNVADAGMREYLMGVAEHWLRFGIDGWRLDVPAEIEDPTFWSEFRRRCRAVDPAAYLVGEIWDEAPEWLLGDRFDALMNYPLGTAIIGFASAGRLDTAIIEQHGTYRRMLGPLDARGFARRLEHLMSVYDPAVTAVQFNLLGSHDAPRLLTLLRRDRAAARVAMLLQLTLPGAPCIYYGDELGMEGGNDPDCRRAYPVDLAAGDTELRAFVAATIAARRSHPTLRRGTVRTLAAAGRCLVLLREADGERALVVVNAGTTSESITFELPAPSWRRIVPLDLPGWEAPSLDPRAVEGRRRFTLALPAQRALILLED
jgi:cyclomaltodextrinase